MIEILYLKVLLDGSVGAITDTPCNMTRFSRNMNVTVKHTPDVGRYFAQLQNGLRFLRFQDWTLIDFHWMNLSSYHI